MLWHALKLIWNRKRDNALIIVELALAFLVVFFIAAMGAHSWYLYKQPLGFDWQDTLELRFTPGGQWTEEDGLTLRQVLATVRNLNDVEWAHGVMMPPFRNSRWTSPTTHDGIEVRTMFNQMTDGAPQDLGVELLEGRWFQAADASLDHHPVLINERLRDALFGDESPLGIDIRKHREDRPESKDYRVIGVYRDFRQFGEMSELQHYVLGRFEIENPGERIFSMQVRISPGTPIDFEQTLQEAAQAVAPKWRFTVTPLSKLRDRQIREVVIPLTVGALIAGFLLLMVAFGLFGVLWQNVTRRTDELGLRRAVGASRDRVYRQIVIEAALVSMLAVIMGAMIAVQFPLMASFEPLTWRSSSSGGLAAGVLVLGLAVTCSLYPAWLAARRSPAEALHWE
jgi:putative ABC transport system permease protein